MRHDCFFCHTKTIERLINKFNPGEQAAEYFVFAVNKMFIENWQLPNPMLSREVHKQARIFLNQADLYATEKSLANEVLLKQYKKWETLVYLSNDPFFMAAKLTTAGNIIDFGAHTVPDDIEKEINLILKKGVAKDQIGELKEAVKSASSILYLGDNAGEIVFDKLFIETMDHPNITYVVRGAPVINDVTLKDAKQVGMDKVCKVISNGYDAPSTILPLCSEQLKNLFNQVDLVISKGQGNFEGLMKETRKNLFFLLMTKCNPMAEMLGVEKGSLVISKIETNGL